MADQDTNDLGSTYAGPAAVAGFASDLLSSYFGAAKYRSELAIRKEEREINRILGDAAFDRNMRQLLHAQNDMKEKATLQLEAGRKEFKAQQAKLQVIAAERGMDGQSLTDVHNDLTRSHEKFRELQLLGIQKAQRDLALQKGGLIDARTARIASDVRLPSAPNTLSFLVSNLPGDAIDAIEMYEKYRIGGAGPGPLGEED